MTDSDLLDLERSLKLKPADNKTRMRLIREYRRHGRLDDAYSRAIDALNNFGERVSASGISITEAFPIEISYRRLAFCIEMKKYDEDYKDWPSICVRFNADAVRAITVYMGIEVLRSRIDGYRHIYHLAF